MMALLCAFTVNAQKALKTDSVYITGKVANFEKYPDANSVNIIIDHVLFHEQITYRGKIKSDGTYRIAFLKTAMQDVMLQYNSNIQVILVAPGEHMKLDFDADNYHSSPIFSGDGAQANRDYRAYQNAFFADAGLGYRGNRENRFELIRTAQKDKEPEDCKKSLAALYAKEHIFLTAYLKANKLSPAFAKWAAMNLKYDYFSDVARYAFIHPMMNKININEYSLPDGYYDFISEADFNNIDAIVSSGYGEFLYGYANHINKKNFGKSYAVGKVLEMYFKEKPGLKKDVLLSQAMHSLITAGAVEYAKTFLDKYKANTTDAGIRKSLIAAYNEQVDRLENFKIPVTAQINNTPKSAADSVFSNIIAKYPGKVVYVDFWATWCGPCRAEMPNSKKLKKTLDGKDIVFVYLGVQCEEKLWKAAIAEMEIDGEHFFVDNKGFGAMSDKFKISGIPHYVLVDKQGRVVDDNAKRPGDSQLKEEMEKLLAVK